MSRILARVLGVHAGPEPVRPRLPSLFEPGLDMVTGPGLPAGEPEAAEPETAGRETAGRETAGRETAGRETAGRETAGRDRKAAGHRGARPGGGWPLWGGRRHAGHFTGGAAERPAGAGALGARAAVGQAGLAGHAASARPSAAKRAPAGTAARAPGPSRVGAPAAGRAARTSAAPAGQHGRPGRTGYQPADQAPAAAAHREPTRRRQLPELSPAPGGRPGWPAPRRAVPRPVQDPAGAEPAVHITIGQVEIRADRAAEPPAARPARQPRRVAPDLSDYLQRRGGPR